ncbi:MAG: DUF5701 family protein [Ktedonobacteraceae bacterium]
MLEKEFDRQVENALQKGYPNLRGIGREPFKKQIEPLKRRLGELIASTHETPKGPIPFVLVIKHELASAEAVMPLVEIKGVQGVVNMRPVTPSSFQPIEGMNLPKSMAYLLVDIDTGRETLNVTPSHALKIIQKANRSPLTIDEGIALILQFPHILTDKKSYNCFSLLGSRRGDQRVPALWMSYGKPRLGWCWANNPHTWLGSASCRKRVGL